MDLIHVNFVLHWRRRDVPRFKALVADIAELCAGELPRARQAYGSVTFSFRPNDCIKSMRLVDGFAKKLRRKKRFQHCTVEVVMRGAEKRFKEYDWMFSAHSLSAKFDARSRFDNWHGYPSRIFVLSIRAGVFHQLSAQGRRGFVERVMRLAAGAGAGFGSVDLEASEATCGALMYTGTCGPADWRLIHRESRWWAYGRERWKYIPSLYWGTFLGPQCMAKVLAANPDFTAQARNWTWLRRFDNTQQSHDQWLLDFKGRGVFLALCDDVLECWQLRDRQPHTTGLFCGFGGRHQQFATWVHRQFRAANILA